MKKRAAVLLLAVFFLRAGTASAYTEKEYLQLARLAYENEFYDLSLQYLSQFDSQFPRSELKPYDLILEGLDLRKLNRLPEAKKAFDQAVAGWPESQYAGQAYYLRGETNLSLGSFAEAEGDFRAALKKGLDPQMSAAASQGLLSSLAGQGKFFEAFNALPGQDGSRLSPKEIEANRRVLIGAAERSMSAALDAKDFARVHAVAAALLERFPADPALDRVLYYQANAYWQEGNLDAARGDLLKLRADPDPEIAALAEFRLGDIALVSKDYTVAAAAYRQAESKSPDPEVRSAAQLQLGALARRDQDYAGAADYFQKALNSSAQASIKEKALFEMAGNAFLAGDYKKSAALYQDFRKRFPQSRSVGQAHLQEAFSLYNLKRYAEAKTAFQDLVRAGAADDLTGQAQYGLGLVYIAQGEKARAAGLWERYLTGKQVLSRQAEMVLLLARFFLEDNRPAEAVPYLKRLTASPAVEDGTRAEAYLLLGLAFIKQNRPDESLAALDAGLNLNPGSDLKNTLLKNKADLLLARGDYRNALPIYQQLGPALPDRRGEIMYGTGLCLQNLGRSQEAVPAYMEALMNLPAGSPLTREIKNALAQIKKKQ